MPNERGYAPLLRDCLCGIHRRQFWADPQSAGSQFTSTVFTELLESNGIKISMDGRGRFHDNIFIERLWWTVKHQYLYLRTFEGGSDLQRGLKGWFNFYNQERPHQSLDDKTPDEAYFYDVDAIAEAA